MEGTIIINSESYSFKKFTTITLPKGLDWATNTQAFIRDWLADEQTYFTLHTSGSTGKPKSINIQKSRMEASAEATIQHLNIQNGANTLLCMNADMIGGRMMIVRALIGNWNLHILPPSSSPIVNEEIDFTAMVPLQVQSLLETKEGTLFLNRIKKLIIGGANLSDQLLEKLQSLKPEVYQTFGMTETVSHIALKRVNGDSPSDEYKLIGDNQIEISNEGKLRIFGTVTNNEWVETNDLVERTSNGFKWLGRADLVVNSGGVKILIEPLEKELSTYFKTQIWVWKKEDNVLGEQLVGLTDNQELINRIDKDYDSLKQDFKKYHLPKTWKFVKRWALTASGKPNRKQTLEESLINRGS